MVRLKHRWICLQLTARQSLNGINESDIVEAIEDNASMLWGQVGLAQVRHHSAVCYWYPSMGVCVFKCAADMGCVVHVSMVMMNRIGNVPIRPRVIHVAATLVQTRKYLIKHFNEWMANARENKPAIRALDKLDAMERHEKQMTRIT